RLLRVPSPDPADQLAGAGWRDHAPRPRGDGLDMVSARRRRQRGQALVEFALVGTMLFMVLLVVLDFGRGLFFYTEMATGAREMARQAVLEYNAQSNTTAPGCSPCAVPGVLPQLQSIAGIGYG